MRFPSRDLAHLARRSGCGVLCLAWISCFSLADDPPNQEDSGSLRSADELVRYTEEREPCAHRTRNRIPLFGDLHVHTMFSFDAAANTISATPEDAYGFARGVPIDFWPIVDGKPAGSYAIDRPLDFLAVTDHAEFLGERRLCREPGSPRYDTPFCKKTRESERTSMTLFGTVVASEEPVRVPQVCGDSGQLCRDWARDPWHRIGAAAEAAYDRTPACEFTTFKAYEYTGTPSLSNYHRNVIFRSGRVPLLPVSYIEAPYDSALWEKLDEACRVEDGCEYLTIPHNSNLANGRMAPYLRLRPTIENRQAYAETRLRREPLMEIFQHKGSSECINGLPSVFGEPDELCDVEAVRFLGREETYGITEVGEDGTVLVTETREVTRDCLGEVGANGMVGAGCVGPTDYLRSGLLVGLEQAREIGLNSVKLGVVASTDTHVATPGAVSESDWRGHVSVESTPEERLQPGLLTSGIDGNPGGLAGVWAVENSRDAIFEAMLRRETFGTSGPRITPRFFGGWDYPADLCERGDLVEVGYERGVPMGGDLPTESAADRKPVFVAVANRDPSAMGVPLQQLQLVKGWIDEAGGRRTSVTVIAGGSNGATVDPATQARKGVGHDSLCAVYRDEGFNPLQSAYYYLRVVENPSARWSAYDCARVPAEERPEVCSDGSYPQTIQEMAWTSPIWHDAK
ncbi:MAG: DUF3604 domain-containing protein [Myxococcota bacterium]